MVAWMKSWWVEGGAGGGGGGPGHPAVHLPKGSPPSHRDQDQLRPGRVRGVHRERGHQGRGERRNEDQGRQLGERVFSDIDIIILSIVSAWCL